ncbi:MAG: putative molybdenum carrier protein, partial [Bacteroidales bacterium]
MIRKIISGGQTGADRAALDVAIEHGIPHGGWIPKGRKTEAGRLSSKYQLKEMPTADYPERTEKNVIDSDGTLIISHGELTGGSEYTCKMAQNHNKPWIHVDASKYSVDAAVEVIRAWISGNNIKVLNVAGPRASKDPRIYGTTDTLLTRLIRTFFPKSVDEAVEVLLDGMAPEDRT